MRDDLDFKLLLPLGFITLLNILVKEPFAVPVFISLIIQTIYCDEIIPWSNYIEVYYDRMLYAIEWCNWISNSPTLKVPLTNLSNLIGIF